MDAEFPRTEVLGQLARIRDSKVLALSERLRRFLVWTVQQALDGHAEEISQYALAHEVFDRGPEFDPAADSIVRTEAQRLRRKLAQYYASEGSGDPILISFAPGSYVPAWKRRGPNPLPKTTEPSHRRLVAVLPFKNLTRNPEQDYFCSGTTESIQSHLAEIRSIGVISPVSALCLGASDADVYKLAGEIGVQTIVVGAVQARGSRIRVHARAVDVSSGRYVWARLFDRPADDPFALQDEVANAVSDAIEPSAKKRDERHPGRHTPNREAFKLYLSGREEWNKVTIQGCEKAIDYFLKAILADPQFALPYAGVAEAYSWLMYFSSRSPDDVSDAARRAALQALSLDTACAEAYISLGSITGALDWKWDESEEFFRKGLELQPSYVPGYLQRGFCRTHRCEAADCEADLKAILDLDPLSVRAHRYAGRHAYLFRQYESSVRRLERAVQLGPDISHTFLYRGLSLLQLGREEEAIQAILRSLVPERVPLQLGILTAAYARVGRRAEAEETLRSLQEWRGPLFVSPMSFVYAFAGLERTDEALDWFEKAAAARCSALVHAGREPLFDCLRGERRFQDVLARMNLAPVAAASPNGAGAGR